MTIQVVTRDLIVTTPILSLSHRYTPIVYLLLVVRLNQVLGLHVLILVGTLR